MTKPHDVWCYNAVTSGWVLYTCCGSFGEAMDTADRAMHYKEELGSSNPYSEFRVCKPGLTHLRPGPTVFRWIISWGWTYQRAR